MTERERKILRGASIAPKTADEAAISAAMKNGGGGGGLVIDVTLDPTDMSFALAAGDFDKILDAGAKDQTAIIHIGLSEFYSDIYAPVSFVQDADSEHQVVICSAVAPNFAGDGYVLFYGVIEGDGQGQLTIFPLDTESEYFDIPFELTETEEGGETTYSVSTEVTIGDVNNAITAEKKVRAVVATDDNTQIVFTDYVHNSTAGTIQFYAAMQWGGSAISHVRIALSSDTQAPATIAITPLT